MMELAWVDNWSIKGSVQLYRVVFYPSLLDEVQWRAKLRQCPSTPCAMGMTIPACL